MHNMHNMHNIHNVANMHNMYSIHNTHNIHNMHNRHTMHIMHKYKSTRVQKYSSSQVHNFVGLKLDKQNVLEVSKNRGQLFPPIMAL